MSASEIPKGSAKLAQTGIKAIYAQFSAGETNTIGMIIARKRREKNGVNHAHPVASTTTEKMQTVIIPLIPI
ncbi:hypothetical protein AA105894_1473 [Asaia spathodeae NBRC 105894]|nr:hypothetical protein AA105894_1473 [Asaia spathodeae NBRC 105894]